MTALALNRTEVDGAVVVRPTGLLDLTTYRDLRDGLLKCAAGQPRAVIVRLADGFRCATPAFMSVFTTVWMRVSEWPGVPILLVGESPEHREVLDSGGGGRLVPRFTALDSALAALDQPLDRRRDEIHLPEALVSGLLARDFVREACGRWRVDHLAESAVTVATELVENAVRHARSAPVLRLELRGGRLTIAVRDDSPEVPEQREAEALRPGGRGITIIASLSRIWGCSPWPRGGKVVWAVLGD
ncbi:ATP-binding protein [Saccharothrix hoggarensis]|uniref:ATP-binding protein n=1 Tax=Saccharothrix hoggarensis TaxID=913853 RepID=A0ABW3QP89_9PSEU